MSKNNWALQNIPDLTGKTVIVTGGNSGLGFETVKAFVLKGAEVIMACRSKDKGEKAKAEILQLIPKGKIEVMALDLMDLSTIREFAEQFKTKFSKLDILMNNAGIMTTPYGLTKDGFESQIGTNHLGHFALTGLLLDVIAKTSNARVVTTSSMAHKQGKMNFDDLLYENGKGYTPLSAYGRSKLSNLLFAYELQRFFETNKIDAISVAAHPGVAETNLGRHLEDKFWYKVLLPVFRFMIQNQTDGALPQIRAAVDSEVKGGEYYGPDGFNEMKGNPVLVNSNKASHNVEDAKKLWVISEKLTGVKFKIYH